MTSITVDGQTASLIEGTVSIFQAKRDGTDSPMQGKTRRLPEWNADGTEVVSVKQAAAIMGVQEDVAARYALEAKDADPALVADARAYIEEKVVRHVRTAAGVRRFKQPIGSIIVRDGVPPLKNLTSAVDEYDGAKTVEGSDGRKYHISQAEDDGKWYALKDETMDWDDPAAVADSEEGVYKALDKHVGGKTPKTPAKPAKAPSRASSGATKRPATRQDIKKSMTAKQKREYEGILTRAGKERYYKEREAGGSHEDGLNAANNPDASSGATESAGKTGTGKTRVDTSTAPQVAAAERRKKMDDLLGKGKYDAQGNALKPEQVEKASDRKRNGEHHILEGNGKTLTVGKSDGKWWTRSTDGRAGSRSGLRQSVRWFNSEDEALSYARKQTGLDSPEVGRGRAAGRVQDSMREHAENERRKYDAASVKPGDRVTLGQARSGSLVYSVEKVNGDNAVIADSNGTKRTVKKDRLNIVGGSKPAADTAALSPEAVALVKTLKSDVTTTSLRSAKDGDKVTITFPGKNGVNNTILTRRGNRWYMGTADTKGFSDKQVMDQFSKAPEPKVIRHGEKIAGRSAVLPGGKFDTVVQKPLSEMTDNMLRQIIEDNRPQFAERRREAFKLLKERELLAARKKNAPDTSTVTTSKRKAEVAQHRPYEVIERQGQWAKVKYHDEEYDVRHQTGILARVVVTDPDGKEYSKPTANVNVPPAERMKQREKDIRELLAKAARARKKKASSSTSGDTPVKRDRNKEAQDFVRQHGGEKFKFFRNGVDQPGTWEPLRVNRGGQGEYVTVIDRENNVTLDVFPDDLKPAGKTKKGDSGKA